ncbi:helix-turn-helix domain-containing protein [Nonomuraea glycinis]|uniref:helix-turn-helix domain-containing protein n=1 Tax=Nonomuraea glycinis TaxID=2047744 RepID=UPI002E148D2C|nr:helix-turn-helix domain-containing protein [Nonomuraea glycinis]
MSTSPTARRRRLGHELRRLREAAQLRADEVAARLHWSATKMSRIETGQVSVHHGDVTDLLDIYGVSDEDLRAELGDMARQSRLKGWWHRHRDTFKRGFDSYIGLENDARGLRTYQSQVVPGLLQTEAYARAVICAIAAGQTPADILDKKIAVRLSRQELLIRADPMTLHVILDEAVLRRDVGGAETMAEQRDALITMGKLPNITLQVLPFSAGAHMALDGEFSILEFPDSKDPDVVYLEQKTSGLVLEDPSELDCYSMMFTRLSAQALDPDQSAAFIASLT